MFFCCPEPPRAAALGWEAGHIAPENQEAICWSLTLKKENRPLLRDFSFVLGPRDKAALIGEEGNGKSTLLQALCRREQVEAYCDVEGRVFTGNSRLGYLAQEMPEEERRLPLRAFFDGVDLYENGLLWELELSPDWLESDRPAGSLSGGEKVKARLARLLAGAPDILLLDEPTNDLDIPALEWLEGFIRQSSRPILFISHDETLLENTATVILHLEQVRRKTVPRHTVAALGYADYVRARRLGLDKQEQVARKQRAEYEAQMKRWRQIYDRVDHERLHVAGPRRVAILGENGRGKTTLLRLIWEELRLRRDIRAGYMPQNYGDVLDDRQTPVDYLAPSGDKERRTKACTLLGSLKFTPDEMRRPIAALSGGQKAKLLLAGLLLDGCDVLVLDEPTSNLSPLSCPVIREALSAYGGAILSVTHDRKFMREVCTDWYELTETGLRPLERL